MKRIIGILVIVSLIVQMFPVGFAAEEENTYAVCVFDTYTENNRGRTNRYDKESTLFAGSVYGRTAELRFDISSFKDKEFGGAVLTLNVRTSEANGEIVFYGSPDGNIETAYIITTFAAAQKGKQECRVALTSYVRDALERGEDQISVFVKSSLSSVTIFSADSSDKALRPSLYICKEEPYIKGQLPYVYPEINAAKFKSDLQYGLSKGHPYILGNEADFDRVRENAFGKNKYVTEIYNTVKDKATKFIGVEPSGTDAVMGTVGYNSRGEECREIITNCAFVYQIEGDVTYAERAWKEAEVWINLPSWGTYQYIDNNQPVQALAICYDWLYDWLDQPKRDMLVKALKEKHFDEMYKLASNYEFYKKESGFHGMYYGTNNHALLDNTATFVSAMAIADTDPEYAAKIMEFTFRNMKGLVERWYPDAAWYEGLGYWPYTGPYTAKWIIGMEKALGTSYGMRDIQCIKEIVKYPICCSSPTYTFVVNDTVYMAGLKYLTESIYVLATINGNPAIEKYVLDVGRHDDPLSALVFKTDVDYDSIDAADFELDKFFRNTDMVTMRNTWESDQQIFGGMFVQDAVSTHGTMNSGTLALEAFGHLWITNPGRDSYGLSGYWNNGQDGIRWTYYFSRAEANSCMVFAPGQGGGHMIAPGDIINEFKSSDRGAYAITDLTKTYAASAKSYRRGIEMTNDRTTFAVQDEVELLQPEEVYSFYNINDCSAEISADGKSVILSNNGRYVKANIICDSEYELSIMSTNPLPTSPQPEGNRIIREIKRIAIHFPKIQKVSLRVEFTPYLAEEELLPPPEEIVPLDEWTVPDGEYDFIKSDSILCDGKVLEGFNPATRFYEVENLPAKIEAKADTSKYEVSYKDSDDKRAKYVILKDKESGRICAYAIKLPKIVEPPKVIDVSKYKELQISAVTATTHDGNMPSNTIDGDFETRWSANGRQSLTVELKNTAVAGAIAIAFYNGNSRAAYFDLEVSENGKDWIAVSSCDSSGATNDYEYFDLKNLKAKYIRYKGLGNSTGSWNSITEIKVYGK